MREMKDKEYLPGRQYVDSSRLNARARLHEYNKNPYPWNQWLFDHLRLPEQCRILELGCGTGCIWNRNVSRIPAGWDMMITDFSPGMLDDARRNLTTLHRNFRFEVVDAMSIPFDSASYDAVVANHMLYLVTDCMRTISEIRRVLRADGQLYASTVGNNHMIELHQLVSRYISGNGDDGKRIAANFGLQTGRKKLERYFSNVELFIYEDSLSVPEVQPVVDYILSLDIADDTAHENLGKLYRALEEMIEREGSICITKETGLFIASS